MARERYIQIDVEVVSCPKCGSQERTDYHNCRDFFDVVIGGKCYSKMTLRRCACLECGQHRVERALYDKQKKSAKRTPNVDTMD